MTLLARKEFPADAAHLRFTVGGLGRQAEMIRLMGRLSIDVIKSGDGGLGTGNGRQH